ncbi:helicase associated domain-containing protein [Bombardia bombarda]|uniref:RNA helicase n=1 Tax=Bombardia bombarda TaxID=252184 RepID=A0AA39XJV2_9PEZI|nr:helicase associated domain-containing protein [Bombardia bombarda]
MDELFELELIGIVSKVVSELRNHIGLADKNLAEFAIAKRLESDTFETFKRKMSEIGGDTFPPSLIESIDRLVRLMHPAMKTKATSKHDELDKKHSVDDRSRLFSGLALHDKVPAPHLIDDGLVESELRSYQSQPEMRKLERSPSPQTRKKLRDRHKRTRRDEDQQEEGHQLRRPPREVDDTPVLYKIYDGQVTGIKDFGAFVNLHGVKGKVDGLVHMVKVKVVSIQGTRIGLSMKDVDQETGQDLAPQLSFGSGANSQSLGGSKNKHVEGRQADAGPAKRQKKRMTSPERWEIRQLIASGVARASDYPGLEEDCDAALNGRGEMELEEDLDIEVRDEEPPFLVGQTKQSLELSPIRIVKAPDGSLNRAAISGAALVRERAELRQLEARAADDKVDTTALSTQWNDPMADPAMPMFASDVRSNRANATRLESMPDRKSVQSKSKSYEKRADMTIKQQRESLPIFSLRTQLIDAVRANQILVVVGETGSGKTTQLTQYLAEEGFTSTGMVGCTQPRRVAATSVAKRMAEEVGCVLGEEVGYAIRFEDRTSPATKIKYMTDGTLQREILLDPDLQRYSVIMIDEAHERTIATDVLFALLKKTINRRGSDFKIIITSATLDAEKFSTYFNDAPIFTIPGRTFPVEILYSREPESDYLDAALTTVMQIHLTEAAGDILLFLTGKEEIDTSCEILQERMKSLGPGVPQLITLPAYAALPTEMQSLIFEPAPPGARKVVIATNIAETSITIDGIYYVIDPGFSKQNAYDPKPGMDSLVITPISQAQANQRAGRAGRTGPGKCFRLYTETAYLSEMLPTTIPDIQRQNLSTTILMLKAMGINDLLHFDFMDPPPINTMLTALEELYALSILDDEGLLTRLGREIADFPITPSLARVLIVAGEMGCSDEILSIVAMLDLGDVFYRPKEKQAQADQKKAKFHDPHGDHLTLLNVYNSWKQEGYSTSWCFENFIQVRSMKRAKDVREQLVGVMKRYRQPVVSCGRQTDLIRRALCAGFFRNAARRETEAGVAGYKTIVEGTEVYIHPSSALFGKQAEWVVYHELVLTTREYMHWTTSIEPKWLVEAAPTLFKIAGTSGSMSKRRQQERIQPLYNKFAGENDWRISAQRRVGKGGGGGGTWG